MRVSVKNKSFILSKVKPSLNDPSADLVWLSSPLIIPSSSGDVVCVASVSTCIAVLPRAVTTALSSTRARVWPLNTAAPTAPARAMPPLEKLAAGSNIKISVSSPACSCIEPSVLMSADPPMVALVVDFTNPTLIDPAPAKPPVEAEIPTTVAVKFCTVSAVTTTFVSAMTSLLIPA